MEPYTKLTPLMVGRRIVVNPTTASAAPADISLTLIETASIRETLFRRPVASLTNVGGLFEVMSKKSAKP